MITVTASAAERIKHDLQAINAEPGACMRLFRSQSTANQLDIALDKERDGDQVVVSEGINVFLLDSELSRTLEQYRQEMGSILLSLPLVHNKNLTFEFSVDALVMAKLNPF